MNQPIFASCPKGLEYLLEQELQALGLSITHVSPQGVYGLASLETAYQLCLWSRIANRIQWILCQESCVNKDQIYQLCRQYPWSTYFSEHQSIHIEFHGSSADIRNTLFGAQLIKDGIVDHFRAIHGLRPSIARENADIRVHAYLKNDSLTLSLDMTGFSMHERGYRKEAGTAPIKENLAAAILMRAHWPNLATQNAGFFDPFCGSGTFVIEAAMMATHRAPGLLRHDQSFQSWLIHKPALWAQLKQDAIASIKPITIPLEGCDDDATLIQKAEANAARAGVQDCVRFHHQSVSHCKANATFGLLIGNPPYGERLGDVTPLVPLYQALGTTLSHQFQGWQAAILTTNPVLAKAIGLRSNKNYTFYNGAMACKLYCFNLDETNKLKHAILPHPEPTMVAPMFANRLKKNHDHLKKWARKNNIQCYRLYDADLPEYAFAIDVYNDVVVIQEYHAPNSIAPHLVEQRRLDVLKATPLVLGLLPSQVVFKERMRQKGKDQYQKLNATQQYFVVDEGRAQFKINVHDYLDTGLFLDHRLMRFRLAKLPPHTRLLNCFCYTATASVHAALNGALTTNVDLSKTYLQWAQENFQLNHIDINKHQFIHEDCVDWLKRAKDRFDVIFCDPPSFSNSKRMEGVLDIQRDHQALIDACMRRLNPLGVLYFSTNLRSFKLDHEIINHYDVKDITPETIDIDFKRNPKIHKVFLITGKD